MNYRSNEFFRSCAAVLLAIAAGASSLAAQTAPTGKLDSIAAANLEPDGTLGAVVGIVKGTDSLFLEAYGKADVESDATMRMDAIFAIGSITKQFTAAAILQLHDQGKLGLDDDITKWVPDYDTRGVRIPLRRLLDHTSGIPDLSRWPELAGLRFDPNTSPDTIYAVIKRYPLQFAPGTAQTYSNTAYWLLHRVIEQASGMPYQQYLERKIFEPLGMKSSGICHGEPSFPRRATGYAARVNWYPDAQMAIVVLMNTSFDSSPTAMVDELAGQLLPGNRPAPKPFVDDAEPLVGTYKGTTSAGPTTIQVARGTEGLTISINGAAAQPLPWVEGLTFRQGGVLLTFRRATGGSGQVTELRYDTGTQHSILARS